MAGLGFLKGESGGADPQVIVGNAVVNFTSGTAQTIFTVPGTVPYGVIITHCVIRFLTGTQPASFSIVANPGGFTVIPSTAIPGGMTGTGFSFLVLNNIGLITAAPIGYTIAVLPNAAVAGGATFDLFGYYL